MPKHGGFPSLKATKVLQILKRDLKYKSRTGSGPGSHTWLDADGLLSIRWAYHNKVTLSPREVRRVFVDQTGLTMEQAKEVLGID